MFFGGKYIEDSGKDSGNPIEATKSNYGTLISHLHKYGLDEIKSKQGKSWIDSVIKSYDAIDQIKDKKLSEQKVKKIFEDNKDSSILSSVNSKLKKDGNKPISSIPSDFTYEFLSNKEKIIDYLIANAQTTNSIEALEKRGYANKIPAEVYKRCKGY